MIKKEITHPEDIHWHLWVFKEHSVKYFFLEYCCKWKELLISASAGKCYNFLLEVWGTPFPLPPKYKLLKSNIEGDIEDKRGIGQILTGWILENIQNGKILIAGLMQSYDNHFSGNKSKSIILKTDSKK